MRETSPGQTLQRPRNALFVDALVPWMLVIAVPLQADLLEVILEPRRAHQIPHLTAQYGQLVRIQDFGAVVLLHQARQRRQRSVAIRMRERRHEMIHDDCMGAALGLRALAGIVHDEWINERQVGEQRVGCAIGRHGHALARQPFQRSMSAEMDEGVSLPLLRQPAIKRGIVMARRQIRRVVYRFRIDAEASRRLNGDKNMAEFESCEQVIAVIGVRLVEREQGRPACRLPVVAPEWRRDRCAAGRGLAPHAAERGLECRGLREKPLHIARAGRARGMRRAVRESRGCLSS